MSAIMLAKVGLEQLVPLTSTRLSSWPITKNSPWVETSGKPRPDALYSPLYSSPRVSIYAATSADWNEGVAKTLEKPPAERDAAVSGLNPVVAPTAVTLR